jgi:hypothetical protein
MRDYHKMDVGLYVIKEKKGRIRTWNFSISNLYNRQNPYYYYFETEWGYDNREKIVLKQLSMFPIMPSVSYSMNF